MKKWYRVSACFSEEDHLRLKELSRQTGLPMAGVFFHVLSNSKMTIRHRNQSLDDCMEELVLIREQIKNSGVTPELLEKILVQIHKISKLWLR